MSWLDRVIADGATNVFLLDEESGSVILDAVGDSDGVLAGASRVVSSLPGAGGGYSTDGGDDSVGLGTLAEWGAAVNLTGEFTIALLFKTNTSSSGNLLGSLNTGTSQGLDIRLNANTSDSPAAGSTLFGYRTLDDSSFVRFSFLDSEFDIYDNQEHYMAYKAKMANDLITCRIDKTAIAGNSMVSDGGVQWGEFDWPLNIGNRNNRGSFDRFAAVTVFAIAFFPTVLSDEALDAQEDELRVVNTIPVANAGTDQTAVEGDTFTLNFEKSYDAEDTSGNFDDGPEPGILIYHVEQISGSVAILDVSKPRYPSAEAPAWTNSENDELVFELIVEDADGGMSVPDIVAVTVLPASAGIYNFDRVTGEVVPVTAHRFDRNA